MRVSASEFYKRPGYYFDLVAQGFTIEITRRGQLITRLEPTTKQTNAYFDIRPLIGAAESSEQGFVFGAFTFGGVWQGMQAFESLEAKLAVKLGIVHWFMNFEQNWDAQLVQLASSKGQIPLISWEPHIALEDICRGEFDAHIKSWASGANAFAKPIYMRPFPEMNGHWTPWNGKPEVLKAAWKHIFELFKAEGANNVKWVWCPNISDEPETPENAMERYFP